MRDAEAVEPVSEAEAALALMEEALSLLDRWGGAIAVGAQLDLAICRLRSHLGFDDCDASRSRSGDDIDLWDPTQAFEA